MITKSTTFIFGAGTSMPYGFPSGGQLVKEICGVTAGINFEDKNPGLLDKGEIAKTLHSVFGEKLTEEFGKALLYSQRYSIDAFLERRPEFIEIGKWAISLFVLRKEIDANLFGFESQDKGCYRYLFDKLDTSWDELPKNKISFITFNYDRSLEHFLFTTLKNTYGKSQEECANVIKQIPIIHVHGSLGQLLWQDKDGTSYGADLEKYNERRSIANAASARASKQIQIIPENQAENLENKSIIELLKNSERIYFLGFSYHDTNMIKIGMETISGIERKKTLGSKTLSRIKGTGFGLETKEIQAIRKWYIDIPDSNIDSLIFLRRYADLD